MRIETVRLVETDKDLLVRLKRSTGIKNWNVLCRWALCISLADPNRPQVDPMSVQSNVEMTWRVFGGQYAEVYWSLLLQRLHEDGLVLDEESVEREFARHLHRGIGALSNVAAKPTIRDVVRLVV